MAMMAEQVAVPALAVAGMVLLAALGGRLFARRRPPDSPLPAGVDAVRAARWSVAVALVTSLVGAALLVVEVWAAALEPGLQVVRNVEQYERLMGDHLAWLAVPLVGTAMLVVGLLAIAGCGTALVTWRSSSGRRPR